MSKKQQIFFFALFAFLAAIAATWAFVVVPKNTGGDVILSQVPPIKSTNSVVIPFNETKAQSEVKTVEETPRPNTPAPSQTQTQKTISVTLHAGDISITLTPEAGVTLFDALSQAGKAGEIIFMGKQYPALGFYVTDIGSLRESAGNHLLYYINGKEATVGASSYIPKDGDVIDWKLE